MSVFIEIVVVALLNFFSDVMWHVGPDRLLLCSLYFLANFSFETHLYSSLLVICNALLSFLYLHTGKLSSRCSAADLLEELSVVLDEAAEPFVLKLWRMLVYYTVKNQQ